MLDFLKTFRPIVSDFLSTIVFIVAYELTNNIILATAIGITSGVAQFVWFKWRGHRLVLMQWMSLALVIVLGTATILTRDPRFVMTKPSVAMAAIGCVMLRRGWQMRYLPDVVKSVLPSGQLIAWGYVWAGLEFALAAANLVIAYGFGTKVWAIYTAFVPLSLQLGLFLLQYVSLRWAVMRRMQVATLPQTS